MKPKLFFYLVIFTSFLILSSCGSKDKKNKENPGSTTTTTTTTTTTGSTDGMVPVIDTANLKTEASILSALKTITDAIIADKKKVSEDPAYTDHSFELVGIYVAITNAADRYAASLNLNDPDKAVEFLNKVKVYRKKFNESN
jgi:hypothetical protein